MVMVSVSKSRWSELSSAAILRATNVSMIFSNLRSTFLSSETSSLSVLTDFTRVLPRTRSSGPRYSRESRLSALKWGIIPSPLSPLPLCINHLMLITTKGVLTASLTLLFSNIKTAGFGTSVLLTGTSWGKSKISWKSWSSTSIWLSSTSTMSSSGTSIRK